MNKVLLRRIKNADSTWKLGLIIIFLGAVFSTVPLSVMKYTDIIDVLLVLGLVFLGIGGVLLLVAGPVAISARKKIRKLINNQQSMRIEDALLEYISTDVRVKRKKVEDKAVNKPIKKEYVPFNVVVDSFKKNMIAKGIGCADTFAQNYLAMLYSAKSVIMNVKDKSYVNALNEIMQSMRVEVCSIKEIKSAKDVISQIKTNTTKNKYSLVVFTDVNEESLQIISQVLSLVDNRYYEKEIFIDGTYISIKPQVFFVVVVNEEELKCANETLRQKSFLINAEFESVNKEGQLIEVDAFDDYINRIDYIKGKNILDEEVWKVFDLAYNISNKIKLENKEYLDIERLYNMLIEIGLTKQESENIVLAQKLVPIAMPIISEMNDEKLTKKFTQALPLKDALVMSYTKLCSYKTLEKGEDKND